MSDRQSNKRLRTVLEHLEVEAPPISTIRNRMDRQRRTMRVALSLFAATIFAVGAGFASLALEGGGSSPSNALPDLAEASTAERPIQADAVPTSQIEAVITGLPVSTTEENSEMLRLASASSIFDYLPDAPMRLSSSIVRGEIVGVEPGRSFTWTQIGEEDIRHVAPFDEPNPLVRSVHVQVSVDAESPQSSRVGDSVLVGLFVRPTMPLSQIERDLLALGDVVLFLNEGAPTLDYAENLQGVAAAGDLFGIVDEAGTIDFPFLDEELMPEAPIRLVDLDLE